MNKNIKQRSQPNGEARTQARSKYTYGEALERIKQMTKYFKARVQMPTLEEARHEYELNQGRERMEEERGAVWTEEGYVFDMDEGLVDEEPEYETVVAGLRLVMDR